MARKRKTQPAAQLTELDKPAPFVPKTVADFVPATSTGRPTKYDPKSTPKLVRGMAKQGLSEGMMARVLEISPSTFSLWKTQYSAFSKALEHGREACNGALEATAVQRALGYSYETEKAFQTGVKITVTETLPPDPILLKFLLERRIPDPYRPSKEVLHTHNAGALFQTVLQRMEEEAKAKALEGPKTIDVSPVLAEPKHIEAKSLIDKDNAEDVTS
jgi:hypothetical protein